MSVTTTADRHLESAANHVSEALKDVNEVVVRRCAGHDDYNEAARERLRKIHAALLELRDDFDLWTVG